MRLKCAQRSCRNCAPIGLITIFLLFLILPSLASADIVIKTKDGKSFAWPNFTMEDNNYCTWLDTGLFCIPVSDVASVKETSSTRAADRYSKTEPMATRGSKGRIITETESGSFDARTSDGRWGYGSGDVYGNANRSGTRIEREVTDQDIQNQARDKWLKEQAAEERQLRMEQERKANEALRQQEANRRRLEAEAARQRYEAERNGRWGWRY